MSDGGERIDVNKENTRLSYPYLSHSINKVTLPSTKYVILHIAHVLVTWIRVGCEFAAILNDGN